MDYYIVGMPKCPICGVQLKLRDFPNTNETYWHCTSCGTQWRTYSLIQALIDTYPECLADADKEKEAQTEKELENKLFEGWN